jgi:sec-independent protein translocase protein TatA
MLRNLSAWHVIILVGVLILLFGANKLPELARGVGQSLRILKSEVKDLTEDDNPPAAAPAPAAQAQPTQPPVATV